ncbi:MAG: T9SS type A sorting domain-containing protein [Bacteroidales bacterium]|nr:T9SS type A sorting domain-containing protein [Bacteroidales bacterium]
MKIKTILLSLAILSYSLTFAQKHYKHLMDDMNVNFYDVVKEADQYFQTHDKGKGSGWKGYQRWKAENESKYFPSGDRSKVDPDFASNAYTMFLENNPLDKGSFDNGWRDLGPYDANNITSHYSAGIGRVECLWVNPNNDQHIYMGSRSGGFWKTNDEGLTWQNTTDYLLASGVNTMDASPTNPDSVLINIRNAGNGTTHGIYRSVDGGNTWTLTDFNPTELGWGGPGSNHKIYKIVYHPLIPDLIFIGTTKGLFRSNDNLNTWIQLLSSSDISDIEFHPTDPDIIYCYDDYYWSSYQNVIFRSTDQGLSFNPSNTISGNNDSKGHISVSPVCPDCVYFASSNGVWKSTDNGINFTFLNNPNSSCHGFAVSDLNNLNIVYGYVDAYASTDGGNSFTQTTWWANYNPDDTYVHADLRAAECVNGVFYIGTDGYLAKSSDGGFSWDRISDGTGIRENYAVGLSQSNWSVQMAGSQDNGTSILDETGWIEWNGGDGMEAIIQTLNDDWMVGSWQYGTRQRTKDGGQSRHGISTPQCGSSQADWQAPLLFDPNNQMKIYHFSDSMFTSEEFGGNWQYVGSPNIGKIKVATIAENNSDILILCRNSDIYLSQDGGQTYDSINIGLPGHSIRDIAFDPNNDSTIVVVYNRYQNDLEKVYISHDLGSSWKNITYNLGDMPIRSVVIDHTNASNIYLGAEIGVFYKAMDDLSWSLYNPNLPNVTVRDLEIQYGSNVLRAATWGRGLWDYTLVGRNDYPSFLTTNITDTPTDITPKEGVNQYVTSVISYDGTLSSVYVKWSANSPTFDSTLVMTNIHDSTWKTQNPIPVYTGGTKMYFKVFAVGDSGDTTETYKFMYTVIPFVYCSSYGSMSYTTAITLVYLYGINNASGKTQPYFDYTPIDTAVINISDNYFLTVNLTTGGNQQVFARAWIDWNRDGDFIDAGEEYDLGSAHNAVDVPSSASPLSITVPANAYIGKTRMRISVRSNSPPTPCLTGFDGEVEDYSVLITNSSSDISENFFGKNITIYPNPALNKFSIDMGNVYSNVRIEIIDLYGRLVYEKEANNTSLMEINLLQPAGVYFVSILANDHKATLKLVKE